MEKAIAAGKHIYCEKPLAADSATALQLLARANAAGVKHAQATSHDHWAGTKAVAGAPAAKPFEIRRHRGRQAFTKVR